MRVRRLVVPREAIVAEGGQGEATLVGDLHHYIYRVLRLEANAPLELSDGEGSRYDGVIEEITTKTVRIRLCGRTSAPLDPEPHITLIYGLARGARTEWVLQKCTELGVSRLLPVICERSVARPQQLSRKAQRWRQIVAGAARQSGRDWLPEVAPVERLADALQQAADASMRLIATVGTGEPLRALGANLQQAASVSLCVGPEGGLTATEVGEAQRNGFQPVSLGPLTLRTETAAVAFVAAVALLGGRLG